MSDLSAVTVYSLLSGLERFFFCFLKLTRSAFAATPSPPEFLRHCLRPPLFCRLASIPL
jgi:hypothetical protein